jgi:formate dehydrogenase subunit gamma
MTSTPGWGAPTATEAPPSEYVTRFSANERALHWLLAVTFLAMLVTGLILYLPSLAQVAADRRLWKTIHLGAAIGFWAGAIVMVVGSWGEARTTAGQLDVFDDDDRDWLKWAVRRGRPEPPQGRFNAGQKLNTAIISGLLVVFTISGTLMYLQETNARFRGVTSAIQVHDWATYIAIPLVLGHLYLALLNPSSRHSLRGMVRGTVRRDWARRHHPKWEEQV